jgi:hypothetical protein
LFFGHLASAEQLFWSLFALRKMTRSDFLCGLGIEPVIFDIFESLVTQLLSHSGTSLPEMAWIDEIVFVPKTADAYECNMIERQTSKYLKLLMIL